VQASKLWLRSGTLLLGKRCSNTHSKQSLEKSMDKDRVAGAAKQAKGKVKDAAGKVTGDEKLRTEGKADKVEGKVQNTFGGLKDKAREALDE
jgi:uncharacterized protein YjbJ (UPF0337 family)